jgi:hypothetical protein
MLDGHAIVTPAPEAGCIQVLAVAFTPGLVVGHTPVRAEVFTLAQAEVCTLARVEVSTRGRAVVSIPAREAACIPDLEVDFTQVPVGDSTRDPEVDFTLALLKPPSTLTGHLEKSFLNAFLIAD